MRRIFVWRNLPETIAAASVKKPIAWEDHERWFQESLRGTNRALFIITEDGESIGQLRFDCIAEGEREISIYLIPGYTGRGLGVVALQIGCEHIRLIDPMTRFVAWVRSDNEPSLRAFRRAHFHMDDWSAQRPDHRRLVSLPNYPIPHVRLTHGPEEEEAVAQVVRSGQWAGGSLAEAVEKEFAQASETKHAVMVGSGLAALRLSLLALGVHAGDRVAVPAYSCVALANAIMSCGAEPVPVDVEDQTWNMSPAALKALKTAEPNLNTAIVVHTFGVPANISAIRACGVRVIEDCSHAFGRSALGNCGDLAILSLYATKLIGAGEGGVILTSDPAIASQLRDSRDYVDRCPAAWRLNDKISGCAAVLARCQLRRLPDLIKRRDAIAALYDETWRHSCRPTRVGLPLTVHDRIWYRYAVTCPDPDRLIRELASFGIHAARPVEPWCNNESRPIALRAFRELVSLPIYPTMTQGEQNHVGMALPIALERALSHPPL
jgi:dTDP-4-amino-4,6-dideoxygalactose transaminase/RimJ/RimL family protein N-acetyltransferase